jgi:non-specific serine/threonine protein kinase
MARYFGAHFADDEQMDRYHELREKHPNLRAALEYALESEEDPVTPALATASLEPDGAPEQPAGTSESSGLVVTAVAQERWKAGAELASSLCGYWRISGLLGEGGYWLTKVLDRFPAPGPERARALVNRGFMRSCQGDAINALADCEAGTAMALALGDDVVTARGYQHTMLTLIFLGRHDEALRITEEARSRLRACGDLAGEVMLMAQLGHLHQLSGRPAECVAVCDEGLSLLGADTREQWLTTYLYAVSGFALFQMPGREADCEAVLRKSLYGKQELGDVVGMAYALDVLGWLSLKTGSPTRTAWLLGAAEPLWERGGSLRFSGTAIMEEFHQQAVAAAAAAIGEPVYEAEYAAGAAYVRALLDVRAGKGALRLDIP